MAKPTGAAIRSPKVIDVRSIEVFHAYEELGPTILATLKIYVKTEGARNIGMQ